MNRAGESEATRSGGVINILTRVKEETFRERFRASAIWDYLMRRLRAVERGTVTNLHRTRNKYCECTAPRDVIVLKTVKFSFVIGKGADSVKLTLSHSNSVISFSFAICRLYKVLM